MSILFSYQTPITIKDATKVKLLLHKVVKAEGFILDTLSIVFTSDEFLYDMNIKYLHHDYYTDIITFDYSNKKNKLINGELYISIHRAQENAKIVKASLQHELRRLMVHGLLHLCGYNDTNPSDKVSMSTREDFYLEKY